MKSVTIYLLSVCGLITCLITSPSFALTKGGGAQTQPVKVLGAIIAPQPSCTLALNTSYLDNFTYDADKVPNYSYYFQNGKNLTRWDELTPYDEIFVKRQIDVSCQYADPSKTIFKVLIDTSKIADIPAGSNGYVHLAVNSDVYGKPASTGARGGFVFFMRGMATQSGGANNIMNMRIFKNQTISANTTQRDYTVPTGLLSCNTNLFEKACTFPMEFKVAFVAADTRVAPDASVTQPLASQQWLDEDAKYSYSVTLGVVFQYL